MPSTPYAGRTRFGLLPENESNPGSLVSSAIINGVVLAVLLVFGSVANHQVQLRRMESTEIYIPSTPPPPVKIKVKVPPAPKVEPKPVIAKLEPPKINVPPLEPKPEPKPLPLLKEEAMLPKIPAAKPNVVQAPQPKLALATAAAPAVTPQAHPVVEATRLGDLNGPPTNPNATRPTVMQTTLGNPNGGNQGPVAAPRGVVNSTGIGNGTRMGSNSGSVGRVASAGIPGGTGNANSTSQGRVATVGIPGMAQASSTPAATPVVAQTTPPVLLSHAQPEYTPEAKQLKIQGDVVLRVTITTSGQMVVHNVIHGLGHGLDEAAERSAPTYKFRPATQNGQPVEYTTNIIIKFQTA